MCSCGCVSLAWVVLPGSVIEIDDRAFAGSYFIETDRLARAVERHRALRL